MNSMEIAIVDRSRLADILRGVGSPAAAGVDIVDGQFTRPLNATSVGVGYCDGYLSSLPHFIVVPGADRREFFAWVNTFCPFVTPLSQWCRVVTQRELADAQATRTRPEYGGAVAAWAGAMIGEAVLHMRTGGKLAQLSTAALHSCATFVAARAFGLWEDRNLRVVAVERFGTARGILGCAERGLPSSDYERAWEVLEVLSGREGGMRQGGLWEEDVTVAACVDIRRTGFVSKGTMTKVLERLVWSDDYLEFERVGAEQRLRIFDTAVERLERMRESSRSLQALAEFTVAYFAARIGGGASGHIGLLERIIGLRPMVAIWYGVASALHRPEVWGPEFGGLGRLALKELTFPWRFGDPPRCDIAIDELTALVEPSRRDGSLRFRGAMRKAVNVEVALGVNGTVPLTWAAEDDGGAARVETMRGELAELNRHLAAATESAKRLNEGYGSAGAGKNASKSGVRKGAKRSRAGEGRRGVREEGS